MVWLSHTIGWLSEVKTTLNLNDRVLRPARGRAARNGITLTRFVEDALRARLAAVRDSKAPFRMRLKSAKGDASPQGGERLRPQPLTSH